MNKYSHGKEQTWWQHLSASCKVYFVLVIVCLAAVAGVGYFVNASNPAKAGHFMMAFCLFVVAIIGLGAIVVCVVNTISSENCASQALAQAEEMCKQAEQLNAQTQEMIREESDRRRREDEYLDNMIDRDGKWEEKAEEMDRQRQTETGTAQPQAEADLVTSLTPEQLAQLWEELNSYDYENDVRQMLDRKYAKQAQKAGKSVGELPSGKVPDDKVPDDKVVAIITRMHTGKINVELVKAELKKQLNAAGAPPEEIIAEQPMGVPSFQTPAALPAPPQQLLLEQKEQKEQAEQAEQTADSPHLLEQSLEEQAAYLGVRVVDLNFYLRGRTHYSQIPQADMRRLQQLARQRA